MEQWCLSEYKTRMHENVIIHCFIQPTCTNKDTNLFYVVLRTLIYITLNVLPSSSNKSHHLFTLKTYQWQNGYFNFFFCYYDKSNLMEKVFFFFSDSQFKDGICQAGALVNFFVNWHKSESFEKRESQLRKMPSLDWPVDRPVGHFLD